VPWTLADVERSIPGAFLEQARLRPSKQAVAGSAAGYTYGELDAASNGHAHRVLDRRGRGPGRTALLLEDDAPLVGATLGVLKAGKTAVVLNPGDPPGRLRQILEDAQPELVLADAEHVELASSAGVSPSDLVTICEEADEPAHDAPDVHVGPADIAFLIYTSGSTGRPKGVMHTHRSFLHLTARLSNHFDLQPDDRLPLLVSSSGFGGAVNVWKALLNGATVCPFLVADKGLAGLAEWAIEQEITILSTFPSLFRPLARTLEGQPPPPVRAVTLGGEPVMPADIDASRRVFGPQCVVSCMLGMTETGPLAHSVVVDGVDPDGGPLPTGPVNEWIELFLLDDEGRPVPPGQTGEIAPRAEYLTPGYWRDEALNAARFCDGPSGRLFRTGDLGRLSADGVLTVLGRKDFQVKVRGNRVSLTEVEGAIASLPGVTGAAVCATPTSRGDNRLTAYLTTPPGAGLTPAGVRHGLASTLPEREMPTEFVFVESFPVTPQGKVDRDRLAEISPPPAPAGGSDVSPRESSDAENRLAAIWARAFEIEGVGPDDDFFALGGDSLTAAVIAAGVHADFGVQLELREFVDNPTVARLTRTIERLDSDSGAEDRPPFVRVSRGGPLPTSFAQERTWRTSQTPEESANYTDALSVRIRGPLDVGVLRRSVDHIARRHEMLRTTFAERDGEPVQVVHPAERVNLPLIDVSSAPDPETEASEALARLARAPFDLRRGPLLRLQLVRTAPEEHHLLWVDHHIITDAWSWRVFFDELRVLYEAFRRDEEAPLPDELPFQYADFAARERSWLRPSTPHYEAELAWWRETLRDAPAASPRLPFARTTSNPDAKPSEGAILWGLEPEVSEGLDRLGREAAATYYMVRLAVLAAQLAIETGSDDLVLGTYATGRRLAQTQGMFGWFSNLVTLRLRLAPDLNFREVLARVRACVTDTTPHTDFPYDELRERLSSDGIVPPEIRLIFNPSDRRPLRISGLELTEGSRSYPAMPWEFTFGPNRRREASGCKVAFDARIHDPAGVREFLGRFQSLAAAVCADPDRPLGAVPAYA
jgi:amino acid adenylation domain-containing protein